MSDEIEADVNDSLVKGTINKMDLGNDLKKQIQRFEESANAVRPDFDTVSLEGFGEVDYLRKPESKCGICKNPYVRMAEHLYLRGQNANQVKKFFEEKGYKVEWVSVKEHMLKHCDFSALRVDYKRKLIERKQELADIESEAISYGMTIVMDQIMDLKSFDTSKDQAATERVSKTVFQGASVLNNCIKIKMESLGLREDLDKAIGNVTDRFMKVMGDILDEITNDMKAIDIKALIANKMRDLQEYFETMKR